MHLFFQILELQVENERIQCVGYLHKLFSFNIKQQIRSLIICYYMFLDFCPPNQVFKECGTACPLTCENYGTVFPCTRQCVAECQCIDGYVLNSEGVCILPEDCPGM